MKVQEDMGGKWRCVCASALTEVWDRFKKVADRAEDLGRWQGRGKGMLRSDRTYTIARMQGTHNQAAGQRHKEAYRLYVAAAEGRSINHGRV